MTSQGAILGSQTTKIGSGGSQKSPKNRKVIDFEEVHFLIILGAPFFLRRREILDGQGAKSGAAAKGRVLLLKDGGLRSGLPGRVG